MPNYRRGHSRCTESINIKVFLAEKLLAKCRCCQHCKERRLFCLSILIIILLSMNSHFWDQRPGIQGDGIIFHLPRCRQQSGRDTEHHSCFPARCCAERRRRLTGIQCSEVLCSSGFAFSFQPPKIDHSTQRRPRCELTSLLQDGGICRNNILRKRQWCSANPKWN